MTLYLFCIRFVSGNHCLYAEGQFGLKNSNGPSEVTWGTRDGITCLNDNRTSVSCRIFDAWFLTQLSL